MLINHSFSEPKNNTKLQFTKKCNKSRFRCTKNIPIKNSISRTSNHSPPQDSIVSWGNHRVMYMTNWNPSTQVFLLPFKLFPLFKLALSRDPENHWWRSIWSLQISMPIKHMLQKPSIFRYKQYWRSPKIGLK